MSRNLFDIAGAFDALTEPVAVYAAAADGDEVLRRGTVPAVVIVGTGHSESAGAAHYAETADRFTVSVSKKAWNRAFAFSPRFGMAFETAAFGRLTVKAVQVSDYEFICRCTANTRAHEK